jgi:hypothetical protein
METVTGNLLIDRAGLAIYQHDSRGGDDDNPPLFAHRSLAGFQSGSYITSLRHRFRDRSKQQQAREGRRVRGRFVDDDDDDVTSPNSARAYTAADRGGLRFRRN